MSRTKHRLVMGMHAGNMWLTSWGYKSELPVDNNKLVSMGEAAVSAIKEVNGREYTVGAAGKIFYPAGKCMNFVCVEVSPI